MNRPRATKIAIAAIEAQIKALAVNVNLHDLYGADAPVCVAAAARRRELRQAIDTLRQPAQARMQL